MEWKISTFFEEKRLSGVGITQTATFFTFSWFQWRTIDTGIYFHSVNLTIITVWNHINKEAHKIFTKNPVNVKVQAPVAGGVNSEWKEWWNSWRRSKGQSSSLKCCSRQKYWAIFWPEKFSYTRAINKFLRGFKASNTLFPGLIHVMTFKEILD